MDDELKAVDELPLTPWWRPWPTWRRFGTSRPARRLWLHGDEDRPLTVAAISRLHLDDAERAYLSACDAACTWPALIDEVIHLASAFQLAGYRQTVGTLWPLVDRPGVRMARHVYRAVAAAGPGSSRARSGTPPSPSGTAGRRPLRCGPPTCTPGHEN